MYQSVRSIVVMCATRSGRDGRDRTFIWVPRARTLRGPCDRRRWRRLGSGELRDARNARVPLRMIDARLVLAPERDRAVGRILYPHDRGRVDDVDDPELVGRVLAFDHVYHVG